MSRLSGAWPVVATIPLVISGIVCPAAIAVDNEDTVNTDTATGSEPNEGPAVELGPNATESSPNGENATVSGENTDSGLDSEQSRGENDDETAAETLANTWGSSSWEIREDVLHIGPGETGPVSIEGEIPWITERGSILSVVFDDPQNTVLNDQSAFLFQKMTKLTEISGITEVDTSNVTTMAYMFNRASALTSLDLSGWDTSNVTTTYSMFSNASALTSLELSNWDTSQVTTMDGMFNSAKALATLDVSKWDTGNVTTMANLFSNTALTSLDLSAWDTSNLTSTYAMFTNASSLQSLDLSKWDTSNVTIMYSMFSGASSLSSIELSDWDTSRVTNMSNMFNGASSLTSLDVGLWDTGNVTAMGSMFAYTKSLRSLDLALWNTSSATHMGAMFWGLQSLHSLDLSGWDIRNVTYMGSMFFNAKSLHSLNLSGWDTSNVKTMTNMFYGATNLEVMSLGEKTELYFDCGLQYESDPEFVWALVGRGTIETPDWSWSGSADEIFPRSAQGIAGTYVWKNQDQKVTPQPSISIVSPSHKSLVYGIPVLEGTGEPGATVTVRGAVRILGSTTVGDDGHWRVTSPFVLTGEIRLWADQIDSNGWESTESVLFTVVPLSEKVSFTSPVNGSTVSGTGLVFTGMGTPGNTITVHGLVRTLGTTTVAEDGTWEVTSSIDLTKDDYYIFATQTDADKVETGKTTVVFSTN